MTVLRTGILGCGFFANRHAEMLAGMKETIQLVAFCDVDESRAHAFNTQYADGEAAIFTDHTNMYAQAELDIVVICLPPFAHSDEVEQAAQHGIHVFIEKPIALTSELGWRMVQAAEDAGIVTQVGFMFRFGKAVEELNTLLKSGEAGPIGLMSARYFCNALHSPWWRDRSLSGGQLLEQVIHMFDLMRFLLGDPVSVYSQQSNVFHQTIPDYTIEDVSVTTVRFGNGALGVIYATNGAIPGQWINDYRVVTQNLTVDFTDSNHAAFHWTAKDDVPTSTITSEDNVYRLEMDDFLHAIRHGTPTRTPIREGAKSLDFVLAATQSAESGVEVPFPGERV